MNYKELGGVKTYGHKMLFNCCSRQIPVPHKEGKISALGRKLKLRLSLYKLSLSLYKLNLCFYKLSLSLENFFYPAGKCVAGGGVFFLFLFGGLYKNPYIC